MSYPASAELARSAPEELEQEGELPDPVLELGPGPTSRGDWLRAVWEHRGVVGVLARKDFQARYKRATLGVLWAVAVPLV